MARIASTTTSGQPVDPSGGMTLDALMARQRMLAQQAGDIAAPRNMQSPWQGAAMLAQTFVNARQGAAAQNQLAAGRQALAQAVAGIDPNTGAVPQASIATAMSLDPDTGLKLLQTSLEARRAERERQQHLADVASAQQFETGKIKEQQAYQSSQPITDIGKIDAELAAGRITQQEADTAKAAMAPETYREPTADERVKYGMIEGQPYKMKIHGSSVEPVSIGAGQQVLPPEIAARLGMGDIFTERYPAIIAEIDAGNVTGPEDYANGVAGYGRVGEVHRQIKSGVDALVRNLTGQGKSESEAIDYASRYQPTLWDTAASLKSKIVGLQEELQGVRSSTTYRRQAPPPPSTPGANPTTPPPPPGTAAPPAADAAKLPSISGDQIEVFQKLPVGAQYTMPGDVDANGQPKIYVKKQQAVIPPRGP